MTLLRKSRNTGQIIAGIMTLECGPAKAKALRWAVVSSITREQPALSSAVGFCHVGDSVWPVSPEWQGVTLDRGLGYFYQPPCQVGEMGELLSNIFSPALRPHLYPLLRPGREFVPCLLKTQLPAQSLRPGLVIFLYWCYPHHREELMVLSDSLGMQFEHACTQ